ncbi:MAG TPA: serine hydrolase domain-containing protein [Niabella sp.]|nr:serine hydrolase domain-containing protein [Niabella sp.]
MNRYLMTILLALVFTNCRKNHSHPIPVTECLSANLVNEQIVPAPGIKSIIENYTSKELPGITFIARKGGQYWQYNSGHYNKEQGAAMKPCLVWPGYSISKMYTATAILKLAEENRIRLDQKINTCLPAGMFSKVPGADKITVRMLLNHSSGIENFWQNPGFIAAYMENPARTYSLNDYLEASQERLFEPGTDISYSNTNYLLLSVIIDHITGQNHEKAFQKYIYNPLALSATFYKTLPSSQQNNTPSLYADTNGSGHLIDYTELSHAQFRNESGSNSIMATPKDFVDFIHGLTHGRLLNAAFFSEMKKEYAGNDGADIYGLGLEYFEKSGTKLYGYSGSSFGGRTLLLYNPKTDVSFFVGVNAGAELGGPVLETIAALMDELISKLA